MERNGPEAARSAFERFVQASREPVLLEPGEEPFALKEGAYELDWRNGRLAIQVWDERRTLTRRVVGVLAEKPGRIELTVERFGKQRGEVLLVDLARSRASTERRGARLVFREQFRQFLWRQFPDWKLAELSAEANLEESLSPAYPRALLRKGGSGWAALGCPPEPGAGAGALTFGLIWLDYLRRRERKLTVEGLAIFLPESDARTTCLRLAFLEPRAARFEVFVYGEDGREERADARDFGNLFTSLERRSGKPPEQAAGPAAWAARLSELPGVERVERGDGSASLRVHGMEFGRLTRTELLFGIESKKAARERDLAEIERLARELARLRSPGAADREHPLFRLHPEGWLESLVRAHVCAIDATLLSQPVYGQTPVFAGGERGVMDLLAVDHTGRLAVIELKASEDIHLPLQALDYWMRVRQHAAQEEFSSRGYFPGIALRPDAPRLLLVAPSLEFHPKTETILSYFSREIEIERVGVNAGWRAGLQVMFRLRGARKA
jgi:hypothetical protein